MSAVVLQVRHLHHRYRNRVVLNDINFDLHTGEILGFLGPNGSGKTTLLSRIAAAPYFSQPEQISITGLRNSRSGLGVLFQSPSLDDKLTAWENLMLAATLYALPAAEAKLRAKSLLKHVGLADRTHDTVKTFSGGMKRRLDIARAFLPQPQLLILDEPTTGLDEAAFRDVWKLLKSLQKENQVSVLLSTHRAEEAEHCDRIAILDHGKIQVCDRPEVLRQKMGKDLIVLTTDNPETLTQTLKQKFNLTAWTTATDVRLECDQGHTWIPKIVEALPNGKLRGVHLRHPTLSDVFLKVTGRDLC